jgi:hypothetical protein
MFFDPLVHEFGLPENGPDYHRRRWRRLLACTARTSEEWSGAKEISAF